MLLLLTSWSKKYKKEKHLTKFGWPKYQLLFPSKKILSYGSMITLITIKCSMTTFSTSRQTSKSCNSQVPRLLKNGFKSLDGFWIGKVWNSSWFPTWAVFNGKMIKKYKIGRQASICLNFSTKLKATQLKHWSFVVMRFVPNRSPQNVEFPRKDSW